MLPRNIKGVLFDVDGTLYHQTPLRIIMVMLLILHHIRQPKALLRKVRIIKAYRKAQETMRKSFHDSPDCEAEQRGITIATTGETPQYVTEVLQEWFEMKPLPYLRVCRRRGLKRMLTRLDGQGFKLGVYSDYPARNKLCALGIADYFNTVVASQDRDVRGFKPNTNGFTVAVARMGLAPSEVLYVGDRAHIDGVGAAAAGMPVIIMSGMIHEKTSLEAYPIFKSLDKLTAELIRAKT